MAQSTVAPVEVDEEYELVAALTLPNTGPASDTWNWANSVLPFSYEGLPPNFSLLQNMAAGAFAGIAVSPLPLHAVSQFDNLPT